MKARPDGFLSTANIDHDGEQFDYIRELHAYLWRVVYPEASGGIDDYLDSAIAKLEALDLTILPKGDNDGNRNQGTYN
jgi:hypothetical protein